LRLIFAAFDVNFQLSLEAVKPFLHVTNMPRSPFTSHGIATFWRCLCAFWSDYSLCINYIYFRYLALILRFRIHH